MGRRSPELQELYLLREKLRQQLRSRQGNTAELQRAIVELAERISALEEQANGGSYE
jgi:hypothetical protein